MTGSFTCTKHFFFSKVLIKISQVTQLRKGEKAFSVSQYIVILNTQCSLLLSSENKRQEKKEKEPEKEEPTCHPGCTGQQVD